LPFITALTVAEGMNKIFARTGFPFVMLTDQGAELTGYIVKELFETFG